MSESRFGRAIGKGETRGPIKIVADAETKLILGAAILGPGGDAVPIQPTISELIPTLLADLAPAQ